MEGRFGLRYSRHSRQCHLSCSRIKHDKNFSQIAIFLCTFGEPVFCCSASFNHLLDTQVKTDSVRLSQVAEPRLMDEKENFSRPTCISHPGTRTESQDRGQEIGHSLKKIAFKTKFLKTNIPSESLYV